MRKLIASIFALSLALFQASGQNNAYNLNDECYKYFSEAEILAGKEGFEEVNSALLHSAITHGDTKAQTL